MPDLTGYIITGIVSLSVGLGLRYLEPKVKVAFWQPHTFLFQLQNPAVVLKTDSLTVQNLGRKAAEQVELVFKAKPDFFQFAPSVPYGETTLPNGEFVVRVDSLGPKEFFTLQVLSYMTVPTLLYVRSKAGPGQPIQIQLQRQFPWWWQYSAAAFTLIGVGFCLYWLIIAVARLSKAVGTP